MDEIRQHLAPLTDWMPDEVRDLLPLEAWWLIALVLALLVLLIVGTVLRGMFRLLFRGRRQRLYWGTDLREDLNTCPFPGGQPSLTVYGYPAWVRLVIAAPGGKGVVVQGPVVANLLERVASGLGAAVQHDRPRICVWPAALSHQGFDNTFHRSTPTGERVGEPSNWVLLAGRAQAGTVPIFVGLGLWTETPTTLGRLNVEENDWRRILGRVLEERGT